MRLFGVALIVVTLCVTNLNATNQHPPYNAQVSRTLRQFRNVQSPVIYSSSRAQAAGRSDNAQAMAFTQAMNGMQRTRADSTAEVRGNGAATSNAHAINYGAPVQSHGLYRQASRQAPSFTNNNPRPGPVDPQNVRLKAELQQTAKSLRVPPDAAADAQPRASVSTDTSANRQPTGVRNSGGYQPQYEQRGYNQVAYADAQAYSTPHGSESQARAFAGNYHVPRQPQYRQPNQQQYEPESEPELQPESEPESEIDQPLESDAYDELNEEYQDQSEHNDLNYGYNTDMNNDNDMKLTTRHHVILHGIVDENDDDDDEDDDDPRIYDARGLKRPDFYKTNDYKYDDDDDDDDDEDEDYEDNVELVDYLMNDNKQPVQTAVSVSAITAQPAASLAAQAPAPISAKKVPEQVKSSLPVPNNAPSPSPKQAATIPSRQSAGAMPGRLAQQLQATRSARVPAAALSSAQARTSSHVNPLPKNANGPPRTRFAQPDQTDRDARYQASAMAYNNHGQGLAYANALTRNRRSLGDLIRVKRCGGGDDDGGANRARRGRSARRNRNTVQKTVTKKVKKGKGKAKSGKKTKKVKKTTIITKTVDQNGNVQSTTKTIKGSKKKGKKTIITTKTIDENGNVQTTTETVKGPGKNGKTVEAESSTQVQSNASSSSTSTTTTTTKTEKPAQVVEKVVMNSTPAKEKQTSSTTKTVVNTSKD